MIDHEILKAVGTTNEALRELFTATAPKAEDAAEQRGSGKKKQGGKGAEEKWGNAEEEQERKKKQQLWERRKKFEERIASRLNEGISFSLKNYQFYSAVDLAWDAPPISPAIYPLLLYAQGKLNLAACATQLGKLNCADQFCKRNEKGEVIAIDLPKFHEVSVNLVRSMITRRLAAQSNKYNSLYPHFKYESRDTSQVGKLRADVMSQRADIAADQFDWKHHDRQVDRDMLLYGFQMDFVRCAWEREIHWQQPAKPPEDKSKEIKKEPVVTREGLAWVNPHPTRIGWDNVYPLSSINTDTGCEWVFFWDVLRYKDVAENPKYWNRTVVGYNSEYQSVFTTYAPYFNQYYCAIKAPEQGTFDLTAHNDRKNWVGGYSQEEGDASIVVANHFEKITPKDWGLGGYPYPAWVRLVVAGWETVVYAEWLGSTPGSYQGFNQKDDRRINLGVGHELLTYQDHMSNLTTALLLALRQDVKIIVIDMDTTTAVEREQMKKDAKGESLYTEVKILEVSRKKLADMGIKMDDVVQLVETTGGGEKLTKIFQAMVHLLQMVERLMALSPQEMGQPAPREISATETNLIAGTTESVYNFISDSIDEGRNAKKRIFYESYINFGEANFRVPVVNRYPPAIIQKAGLSVSDPEETGKGRDALVSGTVLGSKRKLIHDYIFTSRDGAERTSNVEGAKYLAEMLKALLPIPAFQEMLRKQQLADVINEMWRMAGNYDLKLELEQGGDEPVSPSASEQLDAIIEKITARLEENTKEIQRLGQMMGALGGNGNGQPVGAGSRTGF